MTLETAKRIVQEKGEMADKEALAIVRGGMNICETKADSSRKYHWIKVFPTSKDGESSIDAALKEYHKRKQPKRIVVEQPISEPKTIQEPKEEPELKIAKPTFIERIKIKAKAIWKEIDSIVVE